MAWCGVRRVLRANGANKPHLFRSPLSRLQDPRQELMLVLVCMGLTAIKIHSSYTDRIRRYTMNILHLLHYNSLANNRVWTLSFRA